MGKTKEITRYDVEKLANERGITLDSAYQMLLKQQDSAKRAEKFENVRYRIGSIDDSWNLSQVRGILADMLELIE